MWRFEIRPIVPFRSGKCQSNDRFKMNGSQPFGVAADTRAEVRLMPSTHGEYECKVIVLCPTILTHRKRLKIQM